MEFVHLAFYSRDLTQEDIHKVSQCVPHRSLYKFVFGGETRLKKALALVNKLALEELVEVIRFARRRGI